MSAVHIHSMRLRHKSNFIFTIILLLDKVIKRQDDMENLGINVKIILKWI
jgi:hypothetical protein